MPEVPVDIFLAICHQIAQPPGSIRNPWRKELSNMTLVGKVYHQAAMSVLYRDLSWTGLRAMVNFACFFRTLVEVPHLGRFVRSIACPTDEAFDFVDPIPVWNTFLSQIDAAAMALPLPMSFRERLVEALQEKREWHGARITLMLCLCPNIVRLDHSCYYLPPRPGASLVDLLALKTSHALRRVRQVVLQSFAPTDPALLRHLLQISSLVSLICERPDNTEMSLTAPVAINSSLTRLTLRSPTINLATLEALFDACPSMVEFDFEYRWFARSGSGAGEIARLQINTIVSKATSLRSLTLVVEDGPQNGDISMLSGLRACTTLEELTVCHDLLFLPRSHTVYGHRAWHWVAPPVAERLPTTWLCELLPTSLKKLRCTNNALEEGEPQEGLNMAQICALLTNESFSALHVVRLILTSDQQVDRFSDLLDTPDDTDWEIESDEIDLKPSGGRELLIWRRHLDAYDPWRKSHHVLMHEQNFRDPHQYCESCFTQPRMVVAADLGEHEHLVDLVDVGHISAAPDGP